MSFDEQIDLFKAIGHPVRFRVLQSLSRSEKSVGEIEKDTKVSQPGLSQQLAILRKAELVTTRREAKMVFYSLEREKIDQIADSLVKLVGAPPGLRDNHKKPTPGAANFARVMRD
ncbi:metalloregulator ArsR/SmtB family transcription factor [Qipengyuania sp. G39]|uniref:Metalloregulator ArsR/SmtB family transcription factor n=1 Tax=Qipengyuania profundimaris TaxID=3067652 RepID=A0ABT9HNX2_9SPHN|nr:metalloregulator ArsR/SmtB family transcription factor [Qipengyuania sp. G39]MDP4574816.1 metalloregulator ArsR/SmtB family transcription factor [Qipengyuania sp. G39]